MLATIFGGFGIFANMLIYQQSKGKKLLICKLISNVFWALHYGLIGANSACIIASINIFRELIFLRQSEKRKKTAWLFAFVLIGLILSFSTWENTFSIFPSIASALSAVSFGLNKPRVSRLLSFPISSFMITYDIVCQSNMGIVNEILTLCSTVIGLIRLNPQKK